MITANVAHLDEKLVSFNFILGAHSSKSTKHQPTLKSTFVGFHSNSKEEFLHFCQKLGQKQQGGKLGPLFKDVGITALIRIFVYYAHSPQVPLQDLDQIDVDKLLSLKSSAFEGPGLTGQQYIVGLAALCEIRQQLGDIYCVSLKQLEADPLGTEAQKIKFLIVKASILANVFCCASETVDSLPEGTHLKDAYERVLFDFAKKGRFAFNANETLKQEKYGKREMPNHSFERKKKKLSENKDGYIQEILNQNKDADDRIGDRHKRKHGKTRRKSPDDFTKQNQKHLASGKAKGNGVTKEKDTSDVNVPLNSSEFDDSAGEGERPSNVQDRPKDTVRHERHFLDISTILLKTADKRKPLGDTEGHPIDINPSQKKLTSAADRRPQRDLNASLAKGDPLPGLDWFLLRFIPRDAGLRITRPRIQQNPIDIAGHGTRQRMRQRNFRIASMVHLQDLDSVRMSEAGIYYDEDADVFRCYHCSLCVPRNEWPAREDPRELHRRRSPDCHVINPGASERGKAADGQATTGSRPDHADTPSTSRVDVDDSGFDSLFVVSDNYSEASLEM